QTPNGERGHYELSAIRRCNRRSLAEWRFVPRCGRPERATTAGRVSVRQELFGLCPRSDERAWPEVRRFSLPAWNRPSTPSTCFGARRAGAVTGRWGACLAVRTPPAAGNDLVGRLQRLVRQNTGPR